MNKHRLPIAASVALMFALAACGDGAATQAGANPDDVASSAAADAQMAASNASKASPPAGKQWSEIVSLTPQGGYAMGNPDAPITLIEYGAVTCSHCAAFEQSGYAPLKKEFVDSGQVRFELRNFILNAFDIPLTLLTRCAGPDRYFPLTEQVFEQQEALMAPAIKLGENDPQALQDAMNRPVTERFYELGKAMGAVEFFKARGVSEEKARACLSDQKAIEQLVANTESGVKMGVSGTPTFFINGEKSPANEWDDLKQRLIAAGAR